MGFKLFTFNIERRLPLDLGFIIGLNFLLMIPSSNLILATTPPLFTSLRWIGLGRLNTLILGPVRLIEALQHDAFAYFPTFPIVLSVHRSLDFANFLQHTPILLDRLTAL